ncbi:MAG: transglycosylase [Alphaproteobacteria bacterium]|nr:transglycosylase [Alphaproteobacteria bacterium]
MAHHLAAQRAWAGLRWGAAAAAVSLSVSACASRPSPTPPSRPTPPAAAPDFRLAPVSFSQLPGWREAALAPALAAFRRQCDSFEARTPDASVAREARYGGAVRDWLPACSAAEMVAPGGERAFFESHFVANFVESGGGQARLTGYFEPVVNVLWSRAPGYTEPLLERPFDAVTVDVGAFAEAYDSDVLRGAPRRLTGKLYGDRVGPYPSRAEIGAAPPSPAFAWAHPVDVYTLQIQGSGRIRFPDGSERRAAYAFQNGYRWRSAIGRARDLGRITDSSWGGFRRYIDSLDEQGARAALAEDPSYVFFANEAITDPTIGPKGAANVHLTPMGSMAVDPAFHPYGALIFFDAQYDGGPMRGLVVAQDTGGAIRRGPLRGDLFFGTGADAGARAERMNAEGVRFWTLIPRTAGTPVALADPAIAG